MLLDDDNLLPLLHLTVDYQGKDGKGGLAGSQCNLCLGAPLSLWRVAPSAGINCFFPNEAFMLCHQVKAVCLQLHHLSSVLLQLIQRIYTVTQLLCLLIRCQMSWCTGQRVYFGLFH